MLVVDAVSVLQTEEETVMAGTVSTVSVKEVEMEWIL